MRGFITPSQVRVLAVCAQRALNQREISDDHDLLGYVCRLSPLALLELCAAWKAREGIVRRADVVDLEPGWGTR